MTLRFQDFTKSLCKKINKKCYQIFIKIFSRRKFIHCDILVEVGDFQAGGLENVVLGLNETLRKSGYTIGMVILGEVGCAALKAIMNGADIYSHVKNPANYEDLLRNLSPKAVIAHYSTYGAEKCHELNIPFIQVIHNVYMWFTDLQLEEFRKSIVFTSIFIACSDYVREYSIKRLKVPEDLCIVIQNAVCVEKFTLANPDPLRIKLRHKFGFKKDDFIFLSVAAINHQKNPLGLVKSFCNIIQSCPKANLALLGPIYEPIIFEKIKTFIYENNLTNRIHYLGQSNKPENFYLLADAFVGASFFEGGPLVLLEAIISNLPIIITRVGFASQFEHFPGVNLVEPPIDIFQYKGTINELSSSKKFESDFANMLIKTYQRPVKPNISKEMINNMDMNILFKKYVDILESIIKKCDGLDLI